MIVKVDTGMASIHGENQPHVLLPFLRISCFLLGISASAAVMQRLDRTKQSAIMICHFSAIQRQKLLCRQFIFCGKMVC